ncbi:MAG: DUF481 domain-containing protein [Steroidobacteraceae bacterium]
MLKRHMVAGIWVLALGSAAAHAEWKGKGEAGVVVARGNTDTDTVSLKLDMTDEVDQWKHALSLAALRAATDGDTSANRVTAGWQSDYKFSDRAFTFGALRYEKDKFSGFSYQASVTGGFGYNFIATEQVKFSGQVGAGYRRSESDDSATPPNEISNNAIITAGLDFEDAFTATTKLIDKLAVESGADDTLVSNVVGVEVKMSDKLALSVGIDARYHSSPPDVDGVPSKKLDTLSTVNLVYSF